MLNVEVCEVMASGVGAAIVEPLLASTASGCCVLLSVVAVTVVVETIIEPSRGGSGTNVSDGGSAH